MNKKVNFVTLDNGLRVILYSDKSKIKCAAELITLFSGSDKFFIDSNGKRRKIYPGTAHFLEHYVYENSKYGIMGDKFYKNDVIDCNAFTNIKQTSYYFKTIHNFEDNLRILVNCVYNPIFSKEGVEKTKYAVFNEIRESRDKLSNRNYFKKMKFVFNDYEPVIGSVSGVSKITCKYIEDVYKYFYVPKNQILVITGNFDVDKTIGLIKDIYSDYVFVNDEKRKQVIGSPLVVKKEGTIKGGNLDIVEVIYKINLNNLSSYDKYKYDWYVSMFLDGNFSRYFKVNEYLKNNNIITGDVSYSYYYMMGYLIIDISAYTSKKDIFVNVINNVINNIRDFNKDDFELIKKETKLRVSVRSDYPSDMVNPIIDNYILFDYFKEDTIEFVDSLSYDECINVLSKIDFSNRCIVVTKKD